MKIAIITVSLDELVAVASAFAGDTRHSTDTQTAEPTDDTAQSAPVEDTSDAIDVVLKLLSDPEYKLRTVATVCEKSGLTKSEIVQYLRNLDVEIVFRTRRSDGVELIGLASRN